MRCQFSFAAMSTAICLASTSYAYAEDSGIAAVLGSLLLFFVVVLIVNIMLLVWVAKDAKARGQSSIGWLVLVFFTGVIGLIIYLLARPKGAVVECEHCKNKKLAAMIACPVCGR